MAFYYINFCEYSFPGCNLSCPYVVQTVIEKIVQFDICVSYHLHSKMYKQTDQHKTYLRYYSQSERKPQLFMCVWLKPHIYFKVQTVIILKIHNNNNKKIMLSVQDGVTYIVVDQYWFFFSSWVKVKSSFFTQTIGARTRRHISNSCVEL